MGIRFLCPQCGSHLQTELRHAGSLAPCPDCGQGVQVPDDAIAPGVLIGDLRLERRLGKGGMGEVYLAHQLTMDRQVAVKILSPGMTRNHLFVQRFVHEALATARLEHPNIVTIHDAGAEEGCHYLTMEYVEGESLDARLKRLKTLPEDEGLKAARTVARALAFAWDRHNMLHRDIKPANIMRGTFGEIKLMDMGLAKSTADPSITATGIAMGTPLYMSPEQARGEQGLDCRSDMYSLGATIYHLVSGSPPYPGTNAVEIITRHALEPLPPITEHNPDVSEPCIHLLETLLAKKAQQRPTTWQAVIDDIELVLAGELPNTPAPTGPAPDGTDASGPKPSAWRSRSPRIWPTETPQQESPRASRTRRIAAPSSSLWFPSSPWPSASSPSASIYRCDVGARQPFDGRPSRKHRRESQPPPLPTPFRCRPTRRSSHFRRSFPHPHSLSRCCRQRPGPRQPPPTRRPEPPGRKRWQSPQGIRPPKQATQRPCSLGKSSDRALTK